MAWIDHRLGGRESEATFMRFRRRRCNLSCYPIVFFGKSFVSPNNHSHTFLLYGEMPTVPGYKEVETDDEKGSDLGAVMWYSWPASVVESRALFKDFELPFWNRFDSSGLPLLGQGQSMFGDPLHTLVLLTRGAAWSMGLKVSASEVSFRCLHRVLRAPSYEARSCGRDRHLERSLHRVLLLSLLASGFLQHVVCAVNPALLAEAGGSSRVTEPHRCGSGSWYSRTGRC